MFINEATWDFIRSHVDGDVRQLALRGAKDAAVDMAQALQQIAGWQTARRKLPTWAAVDGLVYPPHLNMEQCSSEQTARYKAAVAQSLFSGSDAAHLPADGGVSSLSADGTMPRRLVDLTGGFGVDFFFMAQGFAERTYVEQNAELCAISSGNFQTLGFSCEVVCGNAAEYLTRMERASLVYLDPARRNEHGGRTYGISDCTPDVLELLPLLMEKADHVMLKLSPMLDWHQAVAALRYVDEVHVVSIGNECKELLLVLSHTAPKSLRLVCANNGDTFECTAGLSQPVQAPAAVADVQAGACLYEPNASIMKAGCFDALTARFAVTPVAANSHLFLSSAEIGDFPGRKFQILSVSSLNKKELTAALSPLKSANISVRNFPMTADQLRKKLKLKDGGDAYIFATTLSDGSRRLLICRKIG